MGFQRQKLKVFKGQKKSHNAELFDDNNIINDEDENNSPLMKKMGGSSLKRYENDESANEKKQINISYINNTFSSN